MERFYDGDQEKLFSEAHVMNPFAKAPAKVVKKDVRRTGPSVEECEVRKFTIHSEFRVCSLCFFSADMFIYVPIFSYVWA